MTTAPKHGSVQDLLPLEDIVEGVICLRGGEYRAIIQAQSVNFALKSEEEQEAVMAGYRSFLNSLSQPVQMLVRILPTNVEPYLTGFRSNVTSQANSEAIQPPRAGPRDVCPTPSRASERRSNGASVPSHAARGRLEISAGGRTVRSAPVKSRDVALLFDS